MTLMQMRHGIYGVLFGVALVFTYGVGSANGQSYYEFDEYPSDTSSIVPSFNFNQAGLSGDGSKFIISLKPLNPRGSEQVTLTVEGISAKISNSYIEWFVNGEGVAAGYGMKSTSITTPPVGQSAQITVRITDRSGISYETTTRVVPGEVDLLWSAGTYVPPLFKGKALATHMAPVRVTAVPFVFDGNGGTTPPELLTYRWKVNGRVRGESGIGRNYIDIAPGLRGAFDVEVTVTNPETGGSAATRITLPRRNAIVQVYGTHPILGIQLERALGNTFSFTTAESSLAAVPYYVSTTDLENVNFKWEIAGQPVETGQKDRLTLRPSQETRVGQASNVSVMITSDKDFMSRASRSIMVQY